MREKNTSAFGRAQEFIWNLIGGSMVVAMVAGVAYTLLAVVSSELHGIDTFWETKYFMRFFVGLLVFYLVLPSIFTGLLGGMIGLTSSNRKNRSF